MVDSRGLVFRTARQHEPGIETHRKKRRGGKPVQRRKPGKRRTELRQEFLPPSRVFLDLLLQRLFLLLAELLTQGRAEDIHLLQYFTHRTAFQRQFLGIVLTVIVHRADVTTGKHPITAKELELRGALYQVHFRVFVRPADQDNAGSQLDFGCGRHDRR